MRSPIYVAIAGLATEKSIPEEIIIEALEQSLITAYQKHFHIKDKDIDSIRVSFDKQTGVFTVWQKKTIVKTVENPETEVTKEEAAQQLGSKGLKLGQEVELDVTPDEFGRIAIQTAKQVVIQQIRELEKQNLYREFLDQQYKLVQGTVIRREANTLYIDLGKVEGVLPVRHQSPGEHYFLGQNLRCIVLDVMRESKQAKVLLSRTHEQFLRRLFELEVPEITQETVIIHGVARDPGVRSKVAVEAVQEGIDPVGACVGQKGVRIKVINEELGDIEKIDIIPYATEPEVFIANALSPAKVLSVKIDDQRRHAMISVDEQNLSLAIGRRGQNIRLASQLVGYTLDVQAIDAVKLSGRPSAPIGEDASTEPEDENTSSPVSSEGEAEDTEE